MLTNNSKRALLNSGKLLKSVKNVSPYDVSRLSRGLIAWKLLSVIFATANPLKSHAPKKLFPLFCNIRAETPKLWSLSSPTLVENHPNRQVTHLC